MKFNNKLIIGSVLIIATSFMLGINSENKDNVILEKAEPIVQYRDNIQGVDQPFPFIIQIDNVNADLENFSYNNEKGKYIYENINNLPIPQRKLLANNKDTVEYIYGYLTGERVDFSYGESVTLNRKYPYYIQWDRRWAYNPLGATDVAIGGCGPVAVSMAIGGLLDDYKITPDVIVEIENAAGYFTPSGTSWDFFPYIANRYGLNSQKLTINQNSINSALMKGNPLIASVNPGKFTTVGHIILIAGIDENGDYIINDPNSLGRSLKAWSYDELVTELRAVWEFSK